MRIKSYMNIEFFVFFLFMGSVAEKRNFLKTVKEEIKRNETGREKAKYIYRFFEIIITFYIILHIGLWV